MFSMCSELTGYARIPGTIVLGYHNLCSPGGANLVDFECSNSSIFAFKETDCDKLHQRKVGCRERGQFSFNLERQNPDTLESCHHQSFHRMRRRSDYFADLQPVIMAIIVLVT